MSTKSTLVVSLKEHNKRLKTTCQRMEAECKKLRATFYRQKDEIRELKQQLETAGIIYENVKHNSIMTKMLRKSILLKDDCQVELDIKDEDTEPLSYAEFCEINKEIIPKEYMRITYYGEYLQRFPKYSRLKNVCEALAKQED